MDVEFDSDSLDRLEVDQNYSAGLSDAVVRAYRRRMQQIRAADGERTLAGLKSLRMQTLGRKRNNPISMHLGDNYRLIVRLKENASEETAVIMDIVNDE